MKYDYSKKTHVHGGLYSVGKGWSRLLTPKQLRIISVILAALAIAVSGIAAREILAPDSSLIISGEQKSTSKDKGNEGSFVSANPEQSSSSGTIPLGTFQTANSQTFGQSGTDPAQNIGSTIQPVTPQVGGMGGGLPEIDAPDTDCGCVNRAIDKATGAAEGAVPQTTQSLPVLF